jgi:hypothetical protein
MRYIAKIGVKGLKGLFETRGGVWRVWHMTGGMIPSYIYIFYFNKLLKITPSTPSNGLQCLCLWALDREGVL